MIIRTNMSSLRSFRESRKTNQALQKNLAKLSSGLQINCAGDDAAGLSISEKMRAKITELDRCQDNVSEGLTLAKTADAALAEINDMLCRAHFLCVEAENGTYSEQERAAISDELNQLFSEIDRISSSSHYNAIPLFRDKAAPPAPAPEPDDVETYHFEYEETITPLGPDQLDIWGTMDFVKTEDFDTAEKAQAAEAVFQLDSSIDLNDASTLEGKSIKIGSYTYTFTSNPSITPTMSVDLTKYATAKDALLSLKNVSHDISDVSVADDGTVTLVGAVTDLTASVTIDGKPIKFTVPDGNGASKNGLMVENSTGDQIIQQVDGSGTKNNQPVYSQCTTKFSLSKITAPLTQEQAAYLNQNSLSFYTAWPVNNNYTYRYTDVKLSGFTAGMTRDEVGAKLAIAVGAASDATIKLSSSYNSSTGDLEVTVKKDGFDGPLRAYMRETKPSGSPQIDYDDKSKWSSSALKFSVQSTSGTMETGPTMTITIPPQSPPFSFNINGYYDYLYYDSTNTPLTSNGYPYTKYSDTPDYKIDTSAIGNVHSDLLNRIADYAKRMSDVDSVSISGNTITIRGNVNSSINLSLKGITTTVTPYKSTSTSVPSEYVLSDGKSCDFSQEASAVFDLGSNIGGLAGKGFSFDGRRIEFTNGPGVSGIYEDVDISACQNAADVAKAVGDKLGSSYTVTVDASNKLTISTTRKNYSYVSVTDGTEGIMSGASVEFSGGKNVGHSQKTLDFSSINANNLDTLLGKGFRINCATCAGEYINVFFCWKNDGSIPASFQRLDKDTGEMRTIHNIPVELSKVTSGDKIVESIVAQVKPSLNHYTDVAVGDPPTTLIAMEKRFGDVRDQNGKLYLGQVQTGLETNFTYTVSVKKVLDNPKEEEPEPDMEIWPSVVLEKRDLKIYVGSEMDGQYIPVHLPYIDLERLNLCPPEQVDLNKEKQDAALWLERVDHANIAISEARGTIGADYNRLEHAFQELAVEHEELTDSESRIRDADVAQLMMENVKLQILSQSQQTMMAQANTLPQQVLQLLA